MILPIQPLIHSSYHIILISSVLLLRHSERDYNLSLEHQDYCKLLQQVRMERGEGERGGKEGGKEGGRGREGGRICEKKKRRRDDMKHEDGLGMNVMREREGTKAKNGKECDTLTDVASSYQRK